MSTTILKLEEDGPDGWKPTLTLDRLQDGRAEIEVTFGQEGESIVLTREQESKLKLALRHPRDT